MVQRGHHYAIVDEVDSILIDEARTPLIISGPSEESIDKYYRDRPHHPPPDKGEEIDEGDGKKSTTGDYVVDEKAHQAALTEEGVEKVEQLLGVRNLYDPENMEILHGVNQALRAHALYQRDVDYLVKDGKVIIVDEFTGRMMPGRRWSDGLHQAVEAKEGVKIERENQTLATITFQNYFRMYKKLAGMTGTADTEAAEFGQIYKLDVTVIPTNRPMIRDDRGGPRLPHAPRRSGTPSSRRSARPAEGAAGAGRHGLDREERDALEAAQPAAQGAARRAQRQVPRARGLDRGPGGPQGGDHHRHQHGRPRHRHRPRRQSRGARPLRGRSGDRARGVPGGVRALPGDLRPRARGGARPRRPAHPRHRAARVAAHRQPAPRPLRPPGGPRLLPLLSLARRRPDADLRLRPHPGPDGHASAWKRGRPIEHGMVTQGHRARPEAGRGAELRDPQAPARVRRRDEQAARGDLQAAPRHPRGARGARLRHGPRRGHPRRAARPPLPGEDRSAGLGPHRPAHRDARLLQHQRRRHEPRRARHRRAARDPLEGRSRSATPRRRAGTTPRSSAASSAPSCSSRSTPPGRTTSSPSTT